MINLDMLRKWVKAEVQAGIADAQPDSDGYYGTGYLENKEAGQLFDDLKRNLNEQRNKDPNRS